MPDVDALCDAYFEMYGEPTPDCGPSPKQELANEFSQAKKILAKLDYRKLWNDAHLEYLRLQESGGTPVLCEVIGEMVTRATLLERLRQDWGWSDRYWTSVVAALATPTGDTAAEGGARG